MGPLCTWMHLITDFLQSHTGDGNEALSSSVRKHFKKKQAIWQILVNIHPSAVFSEVLTAAGDSNGVGTKCSELCSLSIMQILF